MERNFHLPPGPGNPARRIMKRLGNRPAQRHAVRVMFKVAPWRREDRTLRQCCALLQAEGIPTFRGRPWTPGRLSQVLNLGRIGALEVVRPDEYRAIRSDIRPKLHKEEQCLTP